MNYSNPSFPVSPASNLGPMANTAPAAAYTHKAKTAPMAYMGGYPAAYPPAPAAPVYAASDTGIILVLFILLVIISRAWSV